MALYNKMRPLNLNEVKGQDKVTKILLQNIRSKNIPNAMLFVGRHGTGKTTVAKIASRLLNCEAPNEDGACCNQCASCLSILAGNSLDVIELDAASNNGVDNVRSIIETVQYKPIGKWKVVILDEAHMLSTGAFNALLKIMEEPPKNVLFILCTTELHKIPSTIVSRCRKFQFESISNEVIVEKLRVINQQYHKEAEEDALFLIAKAANGSMRDAESIYDAFMDTDEIISADLVRNTLGYTTEENVLSILEAIVQGNPMLANAVIDEVTEKGASLSYLLEDCLVVLMDIISINLGGDISAIHGSKNYLDQITEYAFSLDTQRLFEIVSGIRKTYEQKSSNLSISLQSMIIGLACAQNTIADLYKRIHTLEERIASFTFDSGDMHELSENNSSMESIAKTDSISVAKQLEYENSCPTQETSFSLEKNILTEESDIVDSSNETANSVPSETVKDQLTDQDLIDMGFQISCEEPVFEEEELDDSMLEAQNHNIPNESSQTPTVDASDALSSPSVESVSSDSSSNSTYNFFAEFARRFE